MSSSSLCTYYNICGAVASPAGQNYTCTGDCSELTPLPSTPLRSTPLHGAGKVLSNKRGGSEI